MHGPLLFHAEEPLETVLESDQEAEARKQAEQLAASEAGEEEIRKRTFTMTSYKADNNPEAVEHLVQTLGLIGGPALTPKIVRRQKSSNEQHSPSSPTLKSVRRKSTKL